MRPDPSSVVGEPRLVAYASLLERVERMGESSDAGEFFERLSAHVRELVPFDAFSIWRYDAEHQMLRMEIWHAPAGLERPPFSEVPVDFGPAGRAVQSQQTVTARMTRGPAPPIVVLLAHAGYRVMCAVPASASDVHWGLLGIASRDLDEYTPETIDLLQRIAALVARSVAGARRTAPALDIAATSDATDRTQLLLRITNAVTSQRHLPALLSLISSLLRETIPHHYASLSIWDEAAQGLRRWAAIQPTGDSPLPEGVLLDRNEPPWLAFDSGDVIQITQEALVDLDTAATVPLVARGLRSGVCLPLKTPRGKYGVLNVGSPRADAFAIPEIMLLWQIARQLALAIENAIYFDRAEQYRFEANAERDRFKLLLDVNNALVSTLDARQLWLSVFETVRRHLHHDFASLVMLDRDTGAVQLEAATYYDERGVLEPRASIERSPVVQALETGAPRTFGGEELDRLDLEGVPAMRSAGLRSACCVPLVTRGKALGVLNVASRQPGGFSQADVDLLRDIAGQIAIACENELAFREISNLKNRLAEEKLYLEGEISSQHDFKEIIGASHTLKAVLRDIQTVASTDATVLLLGETGTGKELLARALHEASRRRDHPFIRLSGAALPAGLIESELFGYEKGAFTGATQARAGRLELAHRGTLFLDEVGDIPSEVQPKLLRVLQEREFERLGGLQTRRVDVRLVAATNRDLEEMVAAGSFRNDLFYRLSVFPIHIPPLRERRGDIPILVQHFVQKAARAIGRHITTIPKATMDALDAWHWPGNIRELQNVIERAVILSPGPMLHVPRAALATTHRRPAAASPAGEARYHSGERAMILKALAEANGVIAGPRGAAARLGLKRTTLQSKMQRLGIKR